jgi:hypothetical protein
LVRYFFLKRPKIEISENLRFLVRILGCRAASLICPVESKPKRRITRRQKIGVMFMASRSRTENHQSEGGEQNAEQRGLRQQTKKKGSNPNFGPFDSTSFQSLRGYRDGPARAPNAISTVWHRTAEWPSIPAAEFS